jgi:molybdopterin molybdotransferase
MVDVSEAEAIIQSHPFSLNTQEVEISQAVGRVLAEEIKADRDFPPFNRVSMDGIAIAFDTFRNGQRDYFLEGTQAAGMPPLNLKANTGAIEVMTGAMLPTGTDAVVRYEDIEIKSGRAIVLLEEMVVGQNIHPQGQDAQLGDLLLDQGFCISPAEIALLASIGKKKVRVLEFPKTAIISTGDELVGIEELPLPWQIRRSNGYAIQAALTSMHHPSYLFHIQDDLTILENQLKDIFLTHELIILSGGVSKGKFDFIPQALEKLGVEKLFHQVSQKPGKPFWFGCREKQVVFALPGNPVSTFLCFYRYIKPWLEKSAGLQVSHSKAVLAEDFKFKPALTYFLQVKVKNEKGVCLAYPDAGGGSGDFANLKEVDGFIELPADRSEFKAGEIFSYFPFR